MDAPPIPRLVDLVHAFNGVVVEQFKKRLEKFFSDSILLWRLSKLLFKILQWAPKNSMRGRNTHLSKLQPTDLSRNFSKNSNRNLWRSWNHFHCETESHTHHRPLPAKTNWQRSRPQSPAPCRNNHRRPSDPVTAMDHKVAAKHPQKSKQEVVRMVEERSKWHQKTLSLKYKNKTAG